MPDAQAATRLKCLEEGSKAKVENKQPSDCPYAGGLERTWWFKGYQHPHHPSTPPVCLTAKPPSSYR
jgi:hypothetical protein